ncbi:MAG: hypothetical protein GXY61_10230 [Lentisphaerae bacterium]|nr:hypothetical protein [Lentisphaerota bacterium]
MDLTGDKRRNVTGGVGQKTVHVHSEAVHVHVHEDTKARIEFDHEKYSADFIGRNN